MVVNGDKCKAIITGKQRLALEHLVVGQGHLPPEIVASEGENQISRGIFITDRYCSSRFVTARVTIDIALCPTLLEGLFHFHRSIMQGEKESLTLLYYPPEEAGQEPVTVIELGPSTNACPQGLCMYTIRTRIQDVFWLASTNYLIKIKIGK